MVALLWPESRFYPDVFGEGNYLLRVEAKRLRSLRLLPVSGRVFKFLPSVFLTAWDLHGCASHPPIPGGDSNSSQILLRSCHLALKIVSIVKFKSDLHSIGTRC